MPPVKKGFAKPKNAKKTISRLLRYMGSYKYFWILVFICVLLSSGASVLGSYLIKPALNDYIMELTGTRTSGGACGLIRSNAKNLTRS